MSGMTMAGKILAFVFDMDGVLIDSHATHRLAWKRFLQHEGKSVSDDELAFILEGRTRSEILRHFLGELGETELHVHGRHKDEIFRSLEHHIRPLPGVMAFLEKLRQSGARLAIATSASEIRTASTIERLGLGGYFEAVITASDVQQGKPHPAVYQLACERLETVPSASMAFDDAPAGVQAATSAGMRCIGVAQDERCEVLLRAGAEDVIADFASTKLKMIEAAVMRTPMMPNRDESLHLQGFGADATLPDTPDR
jgi:HAD superfamily hydrolase (TIGR01509 family)